MEARRKTSHWLLAAAVALVALVGLGSTPWVRQAFGDSKKRKHMTRYKWKKLMNRWARELNVKCNFCHVKKGEEFDFEASTHHKTVALYCDDHFVDQLKTIKGHKVSCVTCHNRKTEFLPKHGKGEKGEKGEKAGKKGAERKWKGRRGRRDDDDGDEDDDD